MGSSRLGELIADESPPVRQEVGQISPLFKTEGGTTGKNKMKYKGEPLWSSIPPPHSRGRPPVEGTTGMEASAAPGSAPPLPASKFCSW